MTDSVMPIGLRMAESLRELSRFPGSNSDVSARLIQLAEHFERGGRMRPEAFDIYFRALRALQSDDREKAEPLLTELADSALPMDAGIAIRMLGFAEFGRRGTHQARAHFASGSLLHTQMKAVPASAHVRMRHRLTNALDIIQSFAPNSWYDVSKTTSEIIAAYGAPRGYMTFDGCSSLERHGCILVNIRRRRTPLVLAETLVHESAHSLLFALSCNDNRVLNPRTERHKSPLRVDPRPLDGIYHAVFVLARMHGFLAEVAQNSQAPKLLRNEAESLLEDRESDFMDGRAVLLEHAKLTEIGRDLLEDAFHRVQSAKQAVAA